MFSIKSMVLCFGLCAVAVSGSLDFIEKCSKTDNDCMLVSAIKALPYFVGGKVEGVPPLDPMAVKNVNADAGELKVAFSNVIFSGAKNAELLSIIHDVEKATLTIKMNLPFHMTGNYVMDGKTGFADITGEGPFTVNSDGIQIIIVSNLATFTGKDDKLHYKVTSFDYEYKLTNVVHLKFENLFNGDKSKAEPVEKLMDENWEVMVNTCGKPLIREIINTFMVHIGKFIKNVPLEDLVKD